jgi:hypothetical protein
VFDLGFAGEVANVLGDCWLFSFAGAAATAWPASGAGVTGLSCGSGVGAPDGLLDAPAACAGDELASAPGAGVLEGAAGAVTCSAALRWRAFQYQNPVADKPTAKNIPATTSAPDFDLVEETVFFVANARLGIGRVGSVVTRKGCRTAGFCATGNFDFPQLLQNRELEAIAAPQ